MTWSTARMDIVGVDAAPVAELRPDPVAAVRRRAADVREHDPVAAPRRAATTSRCGAGAQPRAGRRGRRRRSAARVAGAGGERDPGVDRAARAGRLDQPHLDRREARPASADPMRVRGRGWSPGSSTVDSSIARGPSVARQRDASAEPSRRRAVAGRDRRWRRDVAVDGRRWPAGAAVAASSGNTPRHASGRGPRPSRRSSSRRSRPGPCRPDDHPAGQVAVDPVADRAGRGPGARSTGRSPRCRRPAPTSTVGLMSSSGSASSDADRREPAAVRASTPGWWPQPPGARTSRGSAVAASPVASTSTAQIVGPRAEVRRRGRDRAAKTTVRPSGCQAMSADAPVAAGHLARRGAAAGRRRRTGATSGRRWPSSSQRQSVRVIRRARGLVLRRSSDAGRPARRGTAAGRPPR